MPLLKECEEMAYFKRMWKEVEDGWKPTEIMKKLTPLVVSNSLVEMIQKFQDKNAHFSRCEINIFRFLGDIWLTSAQIARGLDYNIHYIKTSIKRLRESGIIDFRRDPAYTYGYQYKALTVEWEEIRE